MLKASIQRITLFTLAIFGLFAAVTVSQPVLADGADDNADGDTPSDIIISLSATDISLRLAPQHVGATFETAKTDVTVGTSNIAGYALMMSASSTELVRTTADASGKYPVITNLSDKCKAGCTSDTFETNAWGYSFGTSVSYLPIPDSIEVGTFSEATNGEVYTVNLAAKIDNTKEPGTYTSTLAFTAVAAPAPYTIKFDANASASEISGAMANQVLTSGETVALSFNAFSRTGYTFAGWNTNKHGEGTAYTDGASFTAPGVGGSITLYAQWTPAPGVDVNDVVIATVNFGGATTGITITPPEGSGLETINVTTSGTGNTILFAGTTYTLTMTASDPGNHAFSWSATSGNFGSSSSSPTTFTPDNSVSSISVTGTSGYSMQTLTLAQCTTDNDYVVTYDERDKTTYRVKKLLDGNCWMLDNLAFDAVANVNNISTANTNIPSNIESTVLAAFKDGTCPSGGDNYANGPLQYWPDDISNNYTYSAPWIQTDYIDRTTSDANYNWGSGTHKYGVYYNYCAATVGTYCYGSGTSSSGAPSDTQNGVRNISADICPKGWQIPTGNSNGMYNTLYSKYNTTQTAGDINSLQYNFSLPLSGDFSSGLLNNQGSNGNFWSSTRSGVNGMYYLRVSASGVNPSNARNRYYGFSVRCVLKTAMQDFDQTLSASMNTGITMTVYDNRDGTEYKVAKLEDGKVWMLDNLAFDAYTNKDVISSANTNIPSDNETAILTSFKSGNRSAGTQYASSGITTSWSNYGDSYDIPKINTGYINSVYNKVGNGDGKVGVYYNYCAASVGSYCYGYRVGPSTAGNGERNIDADICPKGWRLPTSNSNGEYQALYTAYSSNDSNFRTALSIPLSAYFSNGSAYGLGSVGAEFWSSTRCDADYMYSLHVDSLVNPSNGFYRNYGFSVRCVLQ